MLFINFLSVIATLSLCVSARPWGFWKHKPSYTPTYSFPTMTLTSTAFTYPTGTGTGTGVSYYPTGTAYPKQKRDVVEDLEERYWYPTATTGGMFFPTAFPTASSYYYAKREVTPEKRDVKQEEKRWYYPTGTGTGTGTGMPAYPIETDGWSWPKLKE